MNSQMGHGGCRQKIFLTVCLLSLITGQSGCDNQQSAPSDQEPVAKKEDVEESETSVDSRSTSGLVSGIDIEDTPTQELSSTPGEFPIRFRESQADLGIDFVYDNGASPQKLMTEATSGGVGWFDYDLDGFPDLFFGQGGDAGADDFSQQPTDRLFRNLNGERFLDVSDVSLPKDLGFAHGVTVADFDQDGFRDLYISVVGQDRLYHNRGDGTFEDLTEESGIESPLWGSSAAWGDLDSDGDLDLYVCNYVDYDPHNPIACVDSKGNHGTCHPDDVGPVFNFCFINQGNGVFTEESNERGLNGPGSKSLGVVIADLVGNSGLDVFIANDTTANHLFVNDGSGHFQEQGLALGCAMNGLGNYQASMGVAYGDYDRNGYPDLYVTHFTKDSNTLYQNVGASGFIDVTSETGLHQPTLEFLGFGTVMADFNADGNQELFVANGHIDDWRELSGVAWKMRPQFFLYDGRRWRELTDKAGAYFQKKYLGRGVASADFDRDGDLDLTVVHQNEPAAVLENESESGHWLQFKILGRTSPREAIGTKVTVFQGGNQWTAQLAGGTSYCSGHQSLLHFGLADSDLPCELRIIWPSGVEQTLTNVSVDRLWTVIEGMDRIF